MCFSCRFFLHITVFKCLCVHNCGAIIAARSSGQFFNEISVGDQDGAEEAGTTVNGGQTILNPWMTVGGAATSICQPNEYIM